jgi:hypothetical protein
LLVHIYGESMYIGYVTIPISTPMIYHTIQFTTSKYNFYFVTSYSSSIMIILTLCFIGILLI